MKKYIVFTFLCWSAVGLAQSKITVLKAGSRIPLNNAVVSCKGKVLGSTDSSGILKFNTKCKKVDVKAAGFYEDEAVVDKIMEISLAKADPKTQAIEAVVISDKSDPLALALLQKVNDNYKDNAPQSLDSYAFKSYEKVSFDFDEDSIKQYNHYLNRRLDSLQLLPNTAQKSEKKKDSIENVRILKLMSQSKLFLWERASEYLYSKKYGEKINILDNRVALTETVFRKKYKPKTAHYTVIF